MLKVTGQLFLGFCDPSTSLFNTCLDLSRLVEVDICIIWSVNKTTLHGIVVRLFLIVKLEVSLKHNVKISSMISRKIYKTVAFEFRTVQSFCNLTGVTMLSDLLYNKWDVKFQHTMDSEINVTFWYPQRVPNWSYCFMCRRPACCRYYYYYGSSESESSCHSNSCVIYPS